ncbi:MAG TPA: ATP-binding protein [Puia sp.]|uniref:sensor histidine kinase n=1 Tax=Puia sp. TaxID=2045100 RepID=UPI002C6360E3|nr:ATP-binding protein [Puia sp.]HVU98248.1 ATP-binding protein [Puia sp.]
MKHTLSIRQQLPLLICLLLIVVITLFGSISYLGVRRASIAIGEQRLQSLTQELSSLFQQNAHSLAAATQKLARQDDIVNFFPGDAAAGIGSNGAPKALEKMLADTMTVRAEMRDSRGGLLLAAGRNVSADIAGEFPPAKPDSPFIGRIYLSGDSMFYPSIARIYRGASPEGYLVRWRPVRTSPKAVVQLSQLLGTKAALYFGNDDGTLWTDMLKPVTNTSPTVRKLRKLLHYSGPNGKVIGYTTSIPGSRWLIMVELSEDLILEAANRFLYWMLGIGAVLVIGGSLIAWLISRSVTRRLDRLIHATTVIADGDYSSHVPVDRTDEIGKLAASFNTMMTQVRHTQEQLEDKVQRRTQELEAVNKELEAFSYSVSHDLRAPLRAVSGYTMMLKEDYEHTFDNEAKRITGNILSNVKMMGRLIDDLIGFSRLGKRDVRKELTDMKQLAEACVEVLLPAWPDVGFRLDIGPLPTCMGDSDLLKQVWMNLIGNAMKYSSRQAEPQITIGATTDPAGTVYFIRDNGAGFDMRYADKLFKVFQRLHSHEEFEGTGVGLALVKRILDKHRGDIRAESSPGNGAVFYFRIPA